MVGGTGWYRKTFRVPAAMRGKKLHILFDGVYKRADVWFNGRTFTLAIMFMDGALSGFDLTPALNDTGLNVLAVRAKVL